MGSVPSIIPYKVINRLITTLYGKINGTLSSVRSSIRARGVGVEDVCLRRLEVRNTNYLFTLAELFRP